MAAAAVYCMLMLPSIVHAIVSSIDLNTLDSLARTSFLIHDGLLQNRNALMASTLRCANEHVPVDRDETLRYRARAGNWYYMEDGRGYNGKSGHCARDLVGQCRRCGEVVCRVCFKILHGLSIEPNPDTHGRIVPSNHRHP